VVIASMSSGGEVRLWTCSGASDKLVLFMMGGEVWSII
jgi:hypothetical protein